MYMLKSSRIRLVKSVDFSQAPSSSNLTRLHGCCSLVNSVIMKRMMQTVVRLGELGNTHSGIVFVHKTVSMEVNPRMKVTL